MRNSKVKGGILIDLKPSQIIRVNRHNGLYTTGGEGL